MISNNTDSHNKIEKLEEKKKLELQLLRINYELTIPEILVDKHIKEKGKEKELLKTIKEKENELHKLLNKQYTFEEKIKNKYKIDVENKLSKYEKIDMKH